MDNAQITTTAYTGGYTYENSSLKFINQAEGYIEPDGAGTCSAKSPDFAEQTKPKR